MKPKVLITRPLQQAAIDEVAKHCEVNVYRVDAPMPADELAKAMRDVDGLMSCSVKVGKEAIEGASRLKVVANVGAGYDNIDVETCTRRGVLVTNTPDVLTESTADIAFALLLAAGRRVVEGDAFVRRGLWRRWEWNFMLGSEMHGKTLGLFGFGRIAQAVARRGKGFSMRILYHSRNRVSPDIERELGAQWMSREDLLRESDFLSLHVPLTPETHHAIGRQELSLMRPSSFLINTARGSVVDEEALVQALRAGKLAGAGLDVFEQEPKIHPELLALQNVVLLPHIGSATEETRLQMALLATANLLAALGGRRPPNLRNPEVLDKSSN